ncbi:MAG: metallophosphoesterase, partial [Candidatus Hodarchaeota archaeon]
MLKLICRGDRKKSSQPIVQMLLFLCMLSMPVISNADVRKEISYPGNSEDVYYFIHISDTHIGIPCDFAEINFQNLLEDIDNGDLDPAFIVNTGDLTDGSTDCYFDCECCTPDGPHEDEWITYRGVLDNYPNIRNRYYDIPGNHDRYGGEAGAQYWWDGETGSDGYKYKGVRGSASTISGPKSGNIEGQYSWAMATPLGDKTNLFFGINTCDEVGISFYDWNFTIG